LSLKAEIKSDRRDDPEQVDPLGISNIRILFIHNKIDRPGVVPVVDVVNREVDIPPESLLRIGFGGEDK